LHFYFYYVFLLSFFLFFYLFVIFFFFFFFFSSRRRHTRSKRDWSSDVCSSDLFLAQGYAPTKHRVKLTVKTDVQNITAFRLELRSEERRVGKECRSRWARDE